MVLPNTHYPGGHRLGSLVPNTYWVALGHQLREEHTSHDASIRQSFRPTNAAQGGGGTRPGRPARRRHIRLSVDDHPAEHFAVIAGIGVDAMIMDETDPTLKEKVGSAAYFLAAAKALKRLPVRMTVQLDDRPPVRRRAMICAIANVGELRGNLVLVPG